MNDLQMHLYDRVPPGGFIIVDDHAVDTLFDWPAAVDESRSVRGVVAPLELVDTHGCASREPGERDA